MRFLRIALSFHLDNISNVLLVRPLSTTTKCQRLRSEWRVDRKPANTKLGDEDIIEERKAYGGYKKLKAIQISKGTFSLPSQNFESILPIVDVVHSDAGKHYREQKIMAKGTIVKVDMSEHLNDIKTDELCELNRNSYINQGYALAEITTRPGQVGACNGIILEKELLSKVVEKLKIYENSL